MRSLQRACAAWFILGTVGLLAGRKSDAAEPVLNEILASNHGPLLDEDGDASDWIELYNPGPGAVELEGWFLTDYPADLGKWQFPAVSLEAGRYLVVFASGKDRAVSGSQLHTRFKLESNGEYLALVRPDGVTIAQELAPAYPPQREGIAYGIGRQPLGAPLVAPGAGAQSIVPADASLGDSWTGGEANEPFDDSQQAGWSAGTTGIGFDTQADDVAPLCYLSFDDASDPERAEDLSGHGNDATITSQLELAGNGGGSKPFYTEDSGGRTQLPGDRALDFDVGGDGGMARIGGAALGAFDSATQNDAITISLWIHGSGQQPANDSVFWGSSEPNGTGTRSLNAHVPWSDRVIYWDTSGCCDGTMRVSKQEPDSSKWQGAWNHYLFVKDGDTKRIFQNGALFLEGTNTAALTPIRGFFVGGALNNGDLSYGGRIDDFAVWDRALTASQAAAIAGGSSPLSLSSLAPSIGADVSAAMLGRSASIYIRVPFQVAASDLGPGGANTLSLRMRYEDGFVAYLNGAEVARRNAPEVLRHDSAATLDRARSDALVPEEFDLSSRLASLCPGRNILAIHGLNSSADSKDFLILPELTLARSTAARFLVPPTPGSANAPGTLGFVDVVRFGVDRGYVTAPFTLELSCPTAGARIYFSRNGADPKPGLPGVEEYAGAVSISKTLTLRAAAFKEGYEPSPGVTHTYIFAAQVASQPTLPPGLPSSWSGGAADYQVDPDVVRSTLPGHGLEDALLSIPTVSLAMNPEDLFGASTGIYSNSDQTWERPCSMELIHPDGDAGFQVNAGARIHGYTSRYNYFTPKHSFRVLFKSRYGPSKLEHPLFPDSDASRFDQVVLRGMSTDSWCVMDGWDGPEPGAKRWFRERSQYLREQWMKDSQLDMGNLACHARFVHLFLNGLYWGLYHLTERPTDSFHAEHLGGEREEYDVLKDFAEVQSGNGTAWSEMIALASAGLSTEAAYQRIQGNNPDGSRNPAFPRHVDLDNLIDYMLLHICASADDWPDHNWWAGRRRGSESQGFKFFAWDQEITNMDLAYMHTSWGPRYEEVGAYNTPSYLYAQLRGNASFRMRFADHAHKHLFNGGALTPEASDARWMRRAEEIDRAIVGESARWGDARRATPFKREVEWLDEQDRMRNEYWPGIHPIAIERLRRVSLYPNVEPPALGRNGGAISPGFELEITAPAGTVYYTLDGTDPRLATNGISPLASIAGASPVRLAGTTTVKARAKVGASWSALTEAFFHVDIPLRITEIHYHPARPPEGSEYQDEDFEHIEIENVGDTTVELAGVRISGAVRFDFSGGVIPSLGPGELTVIVRNYAAFITRPGGGNVSIAGEYLGELDNSFERILLTGPAGEPIHDFRYRDAWYPETDGGGYSLVIRDPRADKAAWSAREGWRPSREPGGSPGIDEDAPPRGGLQLPGDFNQDASLDLSDAVGLLTYLFIDGSAGLPCSGELQVAANRRVLDSNGDGRVDLTDAIHVLGYLFLGGPGPAAGSDCIRVEGCREGCEAR